jgi:mannose-6-phosphate isomerase-like protein (cupin superfamily)
MTKPVIASPDDGESFTIGALRIQSRVQASQSGGGFELYDLFLGPFTVDYHVHHTMDETLTVLEGEIEFVVAGAKFVRPAGSVAFVPRGVHHGFTNHGPARARVLALFTPSGRQNEYFRALEKLFAAPSLDTAALQALQKQYDQELVPAGT